EDSTPATRSPSPNRSPETAEGKNFGPEPRGFTPGMPELPEVETMARGLRTRIEGATVRRVTVLDPLVIHRPSPEELAERLRGRRVDRVGRRGKWVVLELDDDGRLVIQPRMTGGFWLEPPKRPEHIRVHFEFDGPQ